MTHEKYRSLCAESEEKAQRELFGEYFSYVYTIVFSRLRGCAAREDIEECVGDVFADIYIYYNSSKELAGDISGFVGTVARRKAADYFSRLTRSRINTIPSDSEEAAEIEAPDNTEKAFDDKELSKTLINCIELLGEPDSTIIMQKYFFMRSSKEISELVSLTPEAVRARISRALKKLREKLIAMNISL